MIDLRLPFGDTPPHLRVYDRRANRFTADRAVPQLGFPVTFLPDGDRALFFRADSRLQEFDLRTGAAREPSPARFGATAVSPDGTMAVVASANRPAELVRLGDWQTRRSFPQFGDVTAVAWSPDDSRVVFGTAAGTLWEWNRSMNVSVPLAGSHRGAVDRLFFNPDGKLLASTAYPGECVVRQIPGDRILFGLSGQALRFSADGRRLAVISGNELVIGELVVPRTLQSVHGPYLATQFSPDGLLLASSGAIGVDFRSAADLQFKANLDLDDCGPVGFHPSGREFVTFGLFSQPWRWPLTPPTADRAHWQIGPAEPAWQRAQDGLVLQPQHYGRHAVWGRTGRFLAAADFRNGQVLVRDEQAGGAPQVVGGLMNAGLVALNPDESYVAAGGVIARGVQVWETATHRPVLTVADHSHVAFSAIGSRFVSSSPHHVQVRRAGGDWAVERELPREQTHENARTPFALQPDGPLIAYATAPGRVCVCDCGTGRVVANLTRPDDSELNWLTFSPDGSRLAFVTLTGALGVWDLGAVREGLEEIGLPGGELPADRPLPGPVSEVRLDRGTKLPPHRQWADNWLRMAVWEQLNGKGADAVAAVNRAITALPLGTPAEERADLFALRGTYHLRNNDPDAASSDLRRAIELVSFHPAGSKSLARLHLVGPPEHRNARAAHALLVPLADRAEPDDEVTALLGITQVRLGRHREGARLLTSVPATAAAPFGSWFLALAHQKNGDPAAAARAIAAPAPSYDFRSPPPRGRRWPSCVLRLKGTPKSKSRIATGPSRGASAGSCPRGIHLGCDLVWSKPIPYCPRWVCVGVGSRSCCNREVEGSHCSTTGQRPGRPLDQIGRDPLGTEGNAGFAVGIS